MEDGVGVVHLVALDVNIPHLSRPSFDLVRLFRRRRSLSLESGEPRLHGLHLRVEFFGPLFHSQYRRAWLGTSKSGLFDKFRIRHLERRSLHLRRGSRAGRRRAGADGHRCSVVADVVRRPLETRNESQVTYFSESLTGTSVVRGAHYSTVSTTAHATNLFLRRERECSRGRRRQREGTPSMLMHLLRSRARARTMRTRRRALYLRRARGSCYCLVSVFPFLIRLSFNHTDETSYMIPPNIYIPPHVRSGRFLPT